MLYLDEYKKSFIGLRLSVLVLQSCPFYSRKVCLHLHTPFFLLSKCLFAMVCFIGNCFLWDDVNNIATLWVHLPSCDVVSH